MLSLQVANQTLHTDRPDLPECFQLSVLSWIPCIYLWAVSPIYLFYLKRNNRGYIMMSIMNRFKTVRGHNVVLLVYALKSNRTLCETREFKHSFKTFLFSTTQRYRSESVTIDPLRKYFIIPFAVNLNSSVTLQGREQSELVRSCSRAFSGADKRWPISPPKSPVAPMTQTTVFRSQSQFIGHHLAVTFM